MQFIIKIGAKKKNIKLSMEEMIEQDHRNEFAVELATRIIYSICAVIYFFLFVCYLKYPLSFDKMSFIQVPLLGTALTFFFNYCVSEFIRHKGFIDLVFVIVAMLFNLFVVLASFVELISLMNQSI